MKGGGPSDWNLPVRESWFILYQIVIYGVLMSDLVEWIRYHMLQVFRDEVRYPIIFAHVCIFTIHQICFLRITLKAASYDLIVLFQRLQNNIKISEKICIQYGLIYDIIHSYRSIMILWSKVMYYRD